MKGRNAKCWSNLGMAGEETVSTEPSAVVHLKDTVKDTRKNSIKQAPESTKETIAISQLTASTKKKSPSKEMMTISQLKKKPDMNGKQQQPPQSSPVVRTLKVGKRVYAAWWKTSARSGPTTFYPGVVKSSEIGADGTTVTYDIRYDDGDSLSNIDGTLVIPRKRYLYKNLKPCLNVGDEVYAAWWEDVRRRTSATWHPGVIKNCKLAKGEYGGRYGPLRLYDVAFDDGDELDDIEDFFVMKKRDYLISIRKTDEDAEWIGVKNQVDKTSIDEWAVEVGWYVATIDGQERSFSQLSGKLMMCF